MANTTSVLTDAYMELRSRAADADAIGDWAERCVLAALTEVADYTARIGDHDHSAHYRADKAGPLVQSALRVQAQALLAYSDWPEDGAEEPVQKPLDLLAALATEVTRAAWAAARVARGDGAGVYRSDVASLRSALRDLNAWVESVAASALPDPTE